MRHLTLRRRPVRPGALLACSTDFEALRWGLPPASTGSPLLRRLEQAMADGPPSARVGCRPGAARRIGAPRLDELILGWLAEAVPAANHQAAIESLALARSLDRLAGRLSAEAWWSLVEGLLIQRQEAARLPIETDPLRHQWLAGELPLTMAYLLPELKPCRLLAAAARKALARGFDELLDGEGLPHARRLDLLHPLLACWTRCRALGEGIDGGCWRAGIERQYRWVVRQALRLTHPDGAAPLATAEWRTRLHRARSIGAPSADGAKAMLRAAVRLAGSASDRLLAVRLFPETRRGAAWLAPAAPNRPPREKLPSTANHSAWAATASMRAAWTADAPRVLVTYADRRVKIEVAAGNDVLFSGPWDLDLRVARRGDSTTSNRGNGRSASPDRLGSLAPESDWEEVCWLADAEAEYLELSADFAGGWRVERHILLARQDRFLFLADAVLGAADAPRAPEASIDGRGGNGALRADSRGAARRSGGGIEYAARLTLAPAARYEPAGLSHEGRLNAGGRRAAMVLPLALPEWRAESAPGSLAAVDGRLELRQTGPGPNLLAPLWIDLDSRRARRALTWRRLTVAESRRIVATEEAVGYRVQVGAAQWLIYRTLSQRANRTLLGHNLSTSMLVARFDRSGEVTPLVEIE